MDLCSSLRLQGRFPAFSPIIRLMKLEHVAHSDLPSLLRSASSSRQPAGRHMMRHGTSCQAMRTGPAIGQNVKGRRLEVAA